VSDALPAHFEHLTLLGSGNLTATGDKLDNVPIDNTGANMRRRLLGRDNLQGSKDNYTLEGGLGADAVAVGRYVANTSGLATSSSGVGQFVFESDVRVLWWDADGAGGSDALRIATLTNVAGFVGSEIMVIA
jgi:Ca2+-binding RTX toxin-like protein